MASIIENLYGFESGVSTDLDLLSGTASYQTTIKRSGTYALRVNPTTTGTGAARLRGYSAAGADATLAIATAWFSFYFYIATAPAANDEEMCRIVNGTATFKWSVRLTSSRTLAIYDSTNTIVSTGSTVLSTGTWYQIGIKAINSASGVGELYINNTLELNPTFNQGATNVGSLILGKNTNQNGQSVDFYYDDVWTDTGQLPPSGYTLGQMLPTADGTNQWTSGTSTSDYTQINEIPASTANYIQDAGAAGAVYTASMQSFSAAGISANSIYGVKVVSIEIDPTATADTFQVGLRSNATDSLTTSSNVAATTEYRAKISQTDPNTSAAWGKTGLEAALFKVVQNTVSEDTRVHWGAFIVAYDPAAATTSTSSTSTSVSTSTSTSTSISTSSTSSSVSTSTSTTTSTSTSTSISTSSTSSSISTSTSLSTTTSVSTSTSSTSQSTTTSVSTSTSTSISTSSTSSSISTTTSVSTSTSTSKSTSTSSTSSSISTSTSISTTSVSTSTSISTSTSTSVSTSSSTSTTFSTTTSTSSTSSSTSSTSTSISTSTTLIDVNTIPRGAIRDDRRRFNIRQEVPRVPRIRLRLR